MKMIQNLGSLDKNESRHEALWCGKFIKVIKNT